MLVGAFFFTQTSIINTNNDKERDISFKNYRPKSSGTIINITTPENKTYIKPMSGYYPATYGFENDENGDVPFGWNSIGTNVQVIPEEDSHNNVVELHDTDGFNHGINQSFPDKSSGTIEFWLKNTDDSKYVYIRVNDLGLSGEHISIYLTAGFIKQTAGIVCSYVSDMWYHLSVEYDCASNYNITVNGVKYGPYAFDGSPISMDNFYIQTRSSETNYYVYVDAIGYSWDPNYNIGDNEEEGLLLSFNNCTTLDWIGYSLDGQTNRTILGNTTISMPANGYHTIQVSANDTSGVIYKSEVLGFTINVPAGGGGPSIGVLSDGGDDGKTTETNGDLIIIALIVGIAIGSGVSIILTTIYMKKRSIVRKPREKIKRQKVKKRMKVVEIGLTNCPLCHNKISPGKLFCTYCGANLKEIEE